ncbi:hypothetical protein Q5H92_21805 [Hymenobacter sp. M29]|uniref:Uncharacterized protein n=1 Tax=Hymenobacter mellowenesis TaxID=3063995 RepID=A0ABT9AGM0_9BACT|nr:hypothetical protein [Hymenobacter sp. M29]MDO7849015.1 hypothetical protein [Hymenobacter sp. M29]
MSFKISIQKSGSLDPDKLVARMTALAQEKALGIARERLAGVSCAEHSTVPEPRIEPQADGFQIRVENICCPAFKEVVESELRGH